MSLGPATPQAKFTAFFAALLPSTQIMNTCGLPSLIFADFAISVAHLAPLSATSAVEPITATSSFGPFRPTIPTQSKSKAGSSVEFTVLSNASLVDSPDRFGIKLISYYFRASRETK